MTHTSGKRQFDAILTDARGGGMAVEVPFSVEEAFGTRSQVRVKGTVDGRPDRGAIAPMGGRHWMGVHKALREAIGKASGDSVTVVVEMDTEERVVTVPEDLRQALAKRKTVQEKFDNFAYTHRKEYVQWVESAKKLQTRQSRIKSAVEKIARGEKVS